MLRVLVIKDSLDRNVIQVNVIDCYSIVSYVHMCNDIEKRYV